MYRLKRLLLLLTLSKLSPGERLLSRAKAQFSADHAGCAQVPQVVTHRAPLSLFHDLDAALSETGPGLQTDQRLEEIIFR